MILDHSTTDSYAVESFVVVPMRTSGWSEKRHIVYINPCDFDRLENPKFLDIAGKIYEVATAKNLSDGHLAMSTSRSQYSDALYSTGLGEALLVSAVNLEGLPRADKVTLQIKHRVRPYVSHSESSKESICVDHLLEGAQRHYEGAPLTVGQELGYKDPMTQKIYDLVVSHLFMNGQKTEGPLFCPAIKPAKGENLSFEVQGKQNIVLVQSIFSHMHTFEFQVTSLRPKHHLFLQDQPWTMGKLPAPFAISLQDLEAKIYEDLQGSQLYLKQEHELDLGSWSAKIAFQKAHGDKHLVQDSRYMQRYEFGTDAHVQLSSCSEILMYDLLEKPLMSSKIKFEVIDIDLHKDSSFPVLAIQELRSLLQGSLKESVMEQEHFVVDTELGKILLQVKKAEAESGAFVESSKCKPRFTWDKDTEFEVSVPKGVNVSLLKDLGTPPLSHLSVRISMQTSSNFFAQLLGASQSEKVTLSKEELHALLKSQLPSRLVSNKEYEICNDENQKFIVRIDDMQVDGKSLEMDKQYALAAQITPETKLNLLSGEGVSLSENLKAVDPSHVRSALVSHGVGGMPDKLVQGLENILVARSQDLEEHPFLRVNETLKGILLHGEPGTGKTTVAGAIAKILGCDGLHTIQTSGAAIFDKFLGQSEKNIRDLFAPAEKAFQELGKKSPFFVLIIDEIDAFATKREKHQAEHRTSILDQFLERMGNSSFDNLLVIGMTNHKDMLDDALLRPGRFGLQVEVKKPDLQGRREIFHIHMQRLLKDQELAKDYNFDDLCGMLLSKKVDIHELLHKTEGWTGAGIKSMLEHVLASLRKRLKGHKYSELSAEDLKICPEDIEKAFKVMPKTDSPELSIPWQMYT